MTKQSFALVHLMIHRLHSLVCFVLRASRCCLGRVRTPHLIFPYYIVVGSLSMMTRSGWINKATPLPIQTRSVRTQTIPTRLGSPDTRKECVVHESQTAMTHATTTSEPEVICVIKQKGLHPLATSFRWPDSTGNAWQQSIRLTIDFWHWHTLSHQSHISPTDRYWNAWLSRKKGHAKLRMFMCRLPPHINAFTQDEAITTHTHWPELKRKRKEIMLMRWWDTNGDPALIKTELKMNKFHLEVVVRRRSSVVQLIFIYRIIMTIIIISPHLPSPSLSQYGVRGMWIRPFGNKLCWSGPWLARCSAEMKYRICVSCCDGERSWINRTHLSRVRRPNKNPTDVYWKSLDVECRMQGLMAVNCIHSSIVNIHISASFSYIKKPDE